MIIFDVCTRRAFEFLGLMKKSAAFITDAGGMLSYAATVTRELQKPSMVETERAIRLLHDGDLVEVYARNGIVKVMQREQ